MARRLGGCLLLCLVGCAHGPGSGQPSIQLWFGGDVHLGARGAEVLLPLTAQLHGVGVVNLEGPVAEMTSPATVERLVNGPGSAEALAAASVAVASIENNHQRDEGEAGLERTAAALRRAGVLPAGDALLERSGVRVMLSAADLTRGIPQGFSERLRLARARADVLVVSLHVTAEPSAFPEPVLEVAVEQALAAGARVVVAHGTHAAGKVERRGDAVIAWGLGNLVFDCDCTTERDGLILEVTLGKGGEVLRAAAVPIHAGLRGAPAALGTAAVVELDLGGGRGRPRGSHPQITR